MSVDKDRAGGEAGESDTERNTVRLFGNRGRGGNVQGLISDVSALEGILNNP